MASTAFWWLTPGEVLIASLTVGNVFTPDLIETWTDYKHNQEILPIQHRPHPHEFELYYDI